MDVSNLANDARRLLRESVVWDNTFPFGPSCGSQAAHLRTLERMHSAGYACVTLTTASDPHNMATTIRKIAIDDRFFDAHAGRFQRVGSADDILRAKSQGKLAVVYSFQGTTPFERNLDLVGLYYRLGVRQALMAYNQKNDVGDGCHERTDAGLSRFGISLVQEMNRVGMLVDCSHTGYRTTMDVFEASRSPVVFSHSNARALVDHERNIHDDQALACARTGGVIGVNGVSFFLGGSDESARRLFRHVDHFVQLVGAEHVGIGLDVVSDKSPLMAIAAANADKYPSAGGYQQEPFFAGPEILSELTELMLRHHYADDQVQGILGGNWLRVARQVWK